MTNSDVTLVSDVPASHPHKTEIESALTAAYAERSGGPWAISVSARPGGSPHEWIVRVKGPRSVSIATLYADKPDIAKDRIRERAARVA